MLHKIRRSSKQLLEPKRNSVSASGGIPQPTSTHRKKHGKLTFFDLPAEIRNVIYEDIARDTVITVPLTTNKNGKKATPVGMVLGIGPIPSLLVVSRQTRGEYLPLLLELATVKVTIKEFDFRNLIRMLGSLYITNLKALRKNERLRLQLLAEKCNKDSIVSLRRWLDSRATSLDRLPWSYSICWKSKNQIPETCTEDKVMKIQIQRRSVLEQNLEAIAQLHKNVGENLQFELQPIIAAFERELGRTPDPLDMRALNIFGDTIAHSSTMCSA